MRAVGKEAGLKSFEQVRRSLFYLNVRATNLPKLTFGVIVSYLFRWRTFTCIQRRSASPTAFSPPRWKADAATSAEPSRNKYQACTTTRPSEKTPPSNSHTTPEGYWCPMRENKWDRDLWENNSNPVRPAVPYFKIYIFWNIGILLQRSYNSRPPLARMLCINVTWEITQNGTKPFFFLFPISLIQSCNSPGDFCW